MTVNKHNENDCMVVHWDKHSDAFLTAEDERLDEICRLVHKTRASRL
jgi:hypothetical protein